MDRDRKMLNASKNIHKCVKEKINVLYVHQQKNVNMIKEKIHVNHVRHHYYVHMIKEKIIA